jgi:hypothetical protein
MSHLKVLTRLLAAFLCGWVFAFLDVIGHVLDYLSRIYFQHSLTLTIRTFGLLLFLLFPLSLGVAAALSVDRRNKDLFPLALLTGQLAVAGFYGYYLPGSLSTHFVFFWLIDALLVCVSSLVTSLVIHFAMIYRRKGFHASEQRVRQEEEP